MITISSDISVKIRAFIDEIRDAVPHELLPLLSTLELQASALEIDEGLVAEVIALLSICSPATGQQSRHNFSKEYKTKLEETYNNLNLALNDIRVQESVINSNRIRR